MGWNNTQRSLVCALGFVLCVPALAKTPRAGGTALVLSQDMGKENDGAFGAPFFVGALSVNLKHSYSAVEVSTGAYRLRLLESENTGFYGLVVLVVNQTVPYTIENRWFVIRDLQNHKHRFSIVGVTALPGADPETPIPADLLVTR